MASLPSASYAAVDSAAAATIENARQYWAEMQDGTIVGGNFDDFQRAVALGWVPNTIEGYDTFLYYWTRPWFGYAIELPDFAGWYLAAIGAESVRTRQNTAEGWRDLMTREIQTRAGLPDEARAAIYAAFAEHFPALLTAKGADRIEVGPAVEYVTNPVTGGAHPVTDVEYHGPDPDEPGMMMFRLVNGDTWRYAGPDWTPPPRRDHDRQGAAVFILSPVLPGGDESQVLAVRWTHYLTDGTAVVSRWERWAGYGSPDSLRAEYGASLDPLEIRYWAELSDAERAEIRADLQPTGWGPDDDGYLARLGPDGTTPIPSNPGGVTIVPAPGSGEPITVFPAEGGSYTIPPNQTPATPPEEWWRQHVTPVTGSPAPGAPATIPEAPNVQAGEGAGYGVPGWLIALLGAGAVYVLARQRRRV